MNFENNDSQKELSEFRLPETLSLLPIENIVLFPYIYVPIVVAEQNGIRLIDDALKESRIIAVSLKKDDRPPYHKIGTAAHITKMLRFPDGTVRVLLQGITRITIERVIEESPYLTANVKELKEKMSENIELEGLSRNAISIFQKVVDNTSNLGEELKVISGNITDPGRLTDFIATNINLKILDKQKILEEANVNNRMKLLNSLLEHELNILKVEKDIQNQVQEEVSKSQREYFLRQQLKAIQEELGEVDEKAAEIKEYRDKLEKLNPPEEVMKEAERELTRLERINPASPEYSVATTFLDWITNLPWNKFTEDNLDIKNAKKVLDEDHYDLDKVKDRILDFLAVRKMKNDLKGPILCFVGPPGVGKTSLGKSIARALGRKFLRFSLGGVRDEAEIRGHRRTYIGALPGKIIQALREVGTSNPVFMLDEIDKLGVDFRGDPASALLEVLDPEQNYSFRDHYLNLSYDLSNVMFITTANLLHPIPGPLRDRMEIIEIPGYTTLEKIQIARKFLIPKQREEHGLKYRQISILKSTTKEVIENYTREAGVRNLERAIATLCRKTVRKLLENKSIKKVKIKKQDLPEFLGEPKYRFDQAAERDEIGVATGLAWTGVGGDILFIEARIVQGSGKLTLTGQLGDVMKESAQAAFTIARYTAEKYGIDPEFYKKKDIHIHIPAGAIPKDGPSAGITLTSALISALSKTPIRKDFAMTGEITLRGLVLPIGGLKEKTLAAHRAGITNVIIPFENKKDLKEIPETVKKGLKFHPVKKIEEVLDLILIKKKSKKNKK